MIERLWGIADGTDGNAAAAEKCLSDFTDGNATAATQKRKGRSHYFRHNLFSILTIGIHFPKTAITEANCSTMEHGRKQVT